MTDLSRFTKLFDSLGIHPKEEAKEEWTILRLDAQDKGKIVGDPEGFVEITFDEAGNLKDLGIWSAGGNIS
jgi:hypothetical protein